MGEITLTLPHNSGWPSITRAMAGAYPKSLRGEKKCVSEVFRDGERESELYFLKFLYLCRTMPDDSILDTLWQGLTLKALERENLVPGLP
ncbi:hypothetical protein TNCV_1049921 [Trichonephila clavipes]|nr:hypothetical protein TNCV_1049921 [Trichonephila clavipes]